MKTLTSAILFFLAGCSPSIYAQTTNTWIEVSPGNELFRVSMPHEPERQPERRTFDRLNVNGTRYSTISGGARYTVWSLENDRQFPSSDLDETLDICADLVWESLLKPARDDLPKDGRARARMTYQKELSKPIPGREYSTTIGELTGFAHLYVTGDRIYVLLVMNSSGSVWATASFFQSFEIKSSSPRTTQELGAPRIGSGIQGNAGAGDTDYNRIFNGRETSGKLRILEKPEPTYTESARKYGVQGTVVLRAVFSKEGEVANVIVLRKLPHGLTQASVAATKRIRFVPAVKDGHAVSQWMQLEYDFNLY